MNKGALQKRQKRGNIDEILGTENKAVLRGKRLKCWEKRGNADEIGLCEK